MNIMTFHVRLEKKIAKGGTERRAGDAQGSSDKKNKLMKKNTVLC